MKTVIPIFISICLFWTNNCYSQGQNKGFLPDKSSYTVLSQPSRSTRDSQLVYNSSLRFPFLYADGAMILLSNDEVKEPVAFVLPEELRNCESMLFVDSLIICKCGKYIMSYDGENIDEVISMTDEQFELFPSNNGYFYLVESDLKTSSAYLVNPITDDNIKLFDAPFLVDNIVGTGTDSYVTSGEMIYFVSQEICTLVDVADSRVQSIDYYSDGAFYSTESACFYMGFPGKSFPILLGDIKQVVFVDNRLYLLFSDGLLSVIDQADQYQVFLNEIMDEVGKVK